MLNSFVGDLTMAINGMSEEAEPYLKRKIPTPLPGIKSRSPILQSLWEGDSPSFLNLQQGKQFTDVTRNMS